MKFYLYRIYLNNGGYDERGVYFGQGQPLYFWSNDYDSDCIRATSRDDAKQLIRKKYPDATFYR